MHMFMGDMTSKTIFGKYAGLVLAIVLFLIIDIGVLVSNVVASHEIEQDASEINTAGELRMVSQQLAKAMLTLEDEVRGSLPTQTSLAQVLEASDEFGDALIRLERSQTGVFGRLFGDRAARDERNRLLHELAAEWQPLGRDVRKMLEHKESLVLDDILPVSIKTVARNLKLLQLSDDLTQQMEDISRDKTRAIRSIQITAITLALVNFIFIVFKFIRQLDASDRRAETARRETLDILATVHQGLFLLHADGRIGEQRSASLQRLFGRTIAGQAHFVNDVLTPVLADAEARENAAEFIAMLFDKKVKPTLLEQINPLTSVEVDTPDDAQHRKKYLHFGFEQVKLGGKVDSLLVSVINVTQEVVLQRELALTAARAKTEIEQLLGILEQDPALLHAFIAGARARIEQMNEVLRHVRADAAAYADAIDRVARDIHAIKGEAALLNLETVAGRAHALEDELAQLRRRDELNGEDLIAVAVGANELLDWIERIDAIIGRLSGFAAETARAGGAPQPVADALAPVVEALQRLGADIARDLGKEVLFEADFPPLRTIPDDLSQLCREALPQLIRNAIVHGIEAPDVRRQHDKTPAGSLRMRFEFAGANGYRIRVRDDGAGISLAALRRSAAATGRFSEAELQRMDDRQLVELLFEPGVSTLAAANRHGGRGDGMAVVRTVLARVGARLRLQSSAGAFTEFVIHKAA